MLMRRLAETKRVWFNRGTGMPSREKEKGLRDSVEMPWVDSIGHLQEDFLTNLS